MKTHSKDSLWVQSVIKRLTEKIIYIHVYVNCPAMNAAKWDDLDDLIYFLSACFVLSY